MKTMEMYRINVFVMILFIREIKYTLNCKVSISQYVIKCQRALLWDFKVGKE